MNTEKQTEVMTKNFFKNVVIGFCLTISSSAILAQPLLCSKEPSPKQSDHRVVQLMCQSGYDAVALVRADEILNGYYQRAYKRTPDKAALVSSQKVWIKKRNACQTKDCLNALYHHRIIELTFLFGDSELHRKGIYPADGVSAFFAFNSEGLQLFDEGKQDYDLVDFEKSGKRNNKSDCGSRHLLGADVTFEQTCVRLHLIVKTVDGQFLSLQPAYGASPDSTWLLPDVLHDGSRLYRQERKNPWGGDTTADDAPVIWFPFDASIRRDDTLGKLAWQYYVVRKKASPEIIPGRVLRGFWDYNQRYGTVNLYSMLYLADQSVIVDGGGFRMNPITGELFEKTLLRRFTSTQVQQWTSAWTHDYLAAHPECQGALATCPNKPQASEYLRTRFEAEMDQQFAQEVQ